MSEQRDKILAAACDLYLSVGRDAFSMRKLAKRVGVTAPALYRHYASREEVLGDVVRRAYAEFTARLYRSLEGRDALERFLGTGQAYLDFALEHPRWYGMMFDSPQEMGMDGLPDDIVAMGCAIHQFWVDRVRECMDEGILKEDDPVQTSLTMWAHLHGTVQLYHQGHLRLDEAEFRRHFQVSGARMMSGVATESFGRELTMRYLEPAHTGAGA